MKLQKLTLELSEVYYELLETREEFMSDSAQRLSGICQVIAWLDQSDNPAIEEVMDYYHDCVEESWDVIDDLNEEIDALNDYFSVIDGIYGVGKTVEANRKVLDFFYSVGIKVTYSLLGNGNVNINLDSLR